MPIDSVLAQPRRSFVKSHENIIDWMAIRTHPGIDYVHLKALGTPKRGRDAAKKGDIATLREVYDAQLGLPEAEVASAAMLDLAAEVPSALLCYEREPGHCHRTLLLAAVARSATVVDLYV